MNTDNSEQLLKDLSFCVIDLETTGGSHTHDQIIEIGIVHIDKMKVGERKNFLINPKRDIPDFIQKLTNITSKTVQDAPTIEQVIDEIIEFIGDRILVAHNSSFDVPFLNSVLKRINKPELKNKVICTNIMTKHLIPEIMSSNLSYMSRVFKIDHEKAHRAIEDAVATAHLLIHYLGSFKKRNIEKINQLYYPRNRFEIDRLKLENSSDNKKKITQILATTNTNLLFIFKGEKGIFQSIIPYNYLKKNDQLINKNLNELDWKVLTIKQVGSMLDSYLFLNTHFYKLEEQHRLDIVENLTKLYDLPESKNQDLDFFITPHLIKGQYTFYNFLNLNSTARIIFRYPGHEKKVLQQLRSSVNRFSNNQKKKKKNGITAEIMDIIHLEVAELLLSKWATTVSIEDVVQGQLDFDKILKKMQKNPLLDSTFPLHHI